MGSARSRCHAVAATAVAACLALAVAGCGSGNAGDVSTGGPGVAPYKGKNWPLFGRTLERTHAFTDAPNPPFKIVWNAFAKQLIEFPPALADGRLYLSDKLGFIRALNARDGKLVWARDLGGADVTGPAFSSRGPNLLLVGREEGEFYGLHPNSGKPAWVFHTPSPIESSPLVVGKTVYFGTDDGTVYALDVQRGKARWKFKAGGPVKSSPSFANGLIYFADYSGDIYAAHPLNGKKVWQVHTGSGGFYSSPAIGFGRLYAARDDGVVVAASAKTGKVEWQRSIGDGVYGSPALADVKGAPPSVYIGGYSKKLYALDAASGKPRWVKNVGGPIPGTSTVLGHTVYSSSFQTRKTIGYDARDGKQVFTFPSAGYTPAISDGRLVFLTGYLTVWGLKPKPSGNK